MISHEASRTEQLLRIPEAAARAATSETAIRRLIKERALPAVLVRGRLRVRLADIEAFIREAKCSK